MPDAEKTNRKDRSNTAPSTHFYASSSQLATAVDELYSSYAQRCCSVVAFCDHPPTQHSSRRAIAPGRQLVVSVEALCGHSVSGRSA